MIPSIEIYKAFQLKLNKNDTNTNIKVPKSQFVLIFNEQKRQWLAQVLETKESSDVIEDLEYLLELDVPLTKISSLNTKDDFQLPDNFAKRTQATILASKGSCTNTPLYAWFVKPKDINVLLQNENQKPSFDYQETLAVINKNRLSVYKDGFNIDEVYLSYYREPKDIDIAGYKKIDGSLSVDVLIDLDKKNIDEIVNRSVIEAARNYESIEQSQLAIQRQQQAEK